MFSDRLYQCWLVVRWRLVTRLLVLPLVVECGDWLLLVPSYELNEINEYYTTVIIQNPY